MIEKVLSLLERFIANERLSVQELKQLRKWMENSENMTLVNKWMESHWEKAHEIESKVIFEEILEKIDRQSFLRKNEPFLNSKWVKYFQRVAAILILPVIIVSSFYYLSTQTLKVQYSEAIVPNGQKSEIILPDSTHIWLNSGTRLRYPVTFGKGNREVFLYGEAYFEVSKNKHQAFIVNTSKLAVKVLGTKFNVKAYPDDKTIETALLEGKINLMIQSVSGKNKVLEMTPGEMINYSAKDSSIAKSGFIKDDVIGWKNNRLVFRDDTFNNLTKKIERWYNVEIIYDKTLFEDQRLTVELLEGESIERLFQIIEKAINVDYRIDKQKIYINPKMKNK